MDSSLLLKRPNLVSARVPSRFERALPPQNSRRQKGAMQQVPPHTADTQTLDAMLQTAGVGNLCRAGDSVVTVYLSVCATAPYVLLLLLLLLLYDMYVSCHRHFFLVLLVNQR